MEANRELQGHFRVRDFLVPLGPIDPSLRSFTLRVGGFLVKCLLSRSLCNRIQDPISGGDFTLALPMVHSISAYYDTMVHTLLAETVIDAAFLYLQ